MSSNCPLASPLLPLGTLDLGPLKPEMERKQSVLGHPQYVGHLLSQEGHGTCTSQVLDVFPEPSFVFLTGRGPPSFKVQKFLP